MSDSTIIQSSFFALALASGLACTSDVVDLGGGTISQNLELGSRCVQSPIIEGDVIVTSQEELDELLGCEEIRGALTIHIFEGTDVAPLRHLRAVDRMLTIGAYPDFPDELTDESLAAWQIEYDRVTAIAEAGWLSSLAGVESLERVGGLALNRISAPDLQALQGLRLITSTAGDGMLGGYLAISSAPNLAELSGLASLTGIRTLEVFDSPALESLDGLRIGSSLDDLTLTNVPRLTDIDALLPLTTVIFDVFFYGTGITDLDGLANLTTASLGFALFENAELTDVSALDGMTITNFLVFEGNPKLESLPEFSNIVSLDAFKAMRNAELRTISLNFPALYAVNIVDGNDIPLSASVIEIGDNAKLEAIAFESGFQSAEMLSIYRNDALARIDLGSFERLDRLHVYGNSSLTDVTLGNLQTVDTLSVTSNPLLSTSELRTVRTFESEFLLNADDPAP